MATTKRSIATEVIKIYSGGNKSKDSGLDVRDVILLVNHVLNHKVKLKFFENYSFDRSGVDGQYIASFPNIDVTKDTARGEYYSLLPSIYVALPNNRGIRQVSPMKNQRDPFIIRQNGNRGIHSLLPSGNLEGRIGLYPEGSKIWYDADMGKKNITKVLIKLVVASPDNIGENDSLPLDAAAVSDVIKEVYTILMGRQPHDKINDNNENK
jgi:hypothetical protein